MDPYVQSIIGEPGFDAQSFIKAVMIDQHANVFSELLKEEPSLFLVEVAGPDGNNVLAANVFSRQFRDTHVPKDVLKALSAKFQELDSRTFEHLVSKLPEDINKWVESGVSSKKAGIIFRCSAKVMSPEQYDTLYDAMAQDWSNCGLDQDFIARHTPEGHNNLLELALGKNCNACHRRGKGAFSSCEHSYHAAVKMTIKQRLNFMVEHAKPYNSSQYWLAKFLRQITPKSKIYCPLCHEKIKSWPGLTLHLQSVHDVPKVEYKEWSKAKTSVYEDMACETGRSWRKHRGKYMDLIDEVKALDEKKK